MSKFSINAASIDGIAASTTDHEVPFNGTAKKGIQLLLSDVEVATNPVLAGKLGIPHEELGVVRSVHRVAIAARHDRSSGGIECFYLFMFETPSQAQAWAKRLVRGCDQTLRLGEEFQELAIIVPEPAEDTITTFWAGESDRQLDWDHITLPDAASVNTLCKWLRSDGVHGLRFN